MWRAKSAHDLSLAMFFVFGLGVVLWLLYGIRIRSLAVITTNSVSLVLVIASFLWRCTMSTPARHSGNRGVSHRRLQTAVSCIHQSTKT